MFELLFPGGMSVLNYSFCRISIVSAVHYKSKVRYMKKIQQGNQLDVTTIVTIISIITIISTTIIRVAQICI